MGGGSTEVKPQAPSPEETQLRQEQIALAQQQRQIIDETMRQQNLLAPYLLENQGYRPVYSQVDPTAVARAGEIDARTAQLRQLIQANPQQVAQQGPPLMAQAGPEGYTVNGRSVPYAEYAAALQQQNSQTLGANPNFNPAWQSELDKLLSERQTLGDRLTAGKITGYELLPEVKAHQDRMKELQAQQDQITGLMQERTLKALRGELPVDPALERQLSEGRLTLGATLRSNLGSGYETSTPGIQALADYDKRAEELRMASRKDELYNTNQLQLAGQQFGTQIDQMRLGNVVGLQNQPYQGAGALASTSQMLNAPLSAYMQDRNAQLQAASQNAQSANAATASRNQAIGAGAGAIASIGAAAIIF